ncbi:MAG: hypothetical protein HQL93_12515 [Magnetococcales bacterium]|nr:hypothetical protein [Magnetococcales bacterium]
MNDYTPYVTAVYLLSLVVYGGYTLRWHISLRKTLKLLEEQSRNVP